MAIIIRAFFFTPFISLMLVGQSVFFEAKLGGRWSDQASAVKEVGGDKIFVSGYSDSISQNGLYDPVLIKLNRFGFTEWTHHFSSPEDDYAFSFSVLRDGNLIIAGEVNSGGADGINAMLLKTDTAGNIIWKKNFGGPGAQSLQFIDTTTDGNLIACGYAASPNGDNDVLVIKLDTAGNIIWQKTHGGMLTDYGDAVRETAGGYVASGVTSSFGAGSTDGWLLRLDGNGDTLWTRTSGDQYAGGCQGVSVLKNGNYILYGEEEIFSGSGFNFWMARYDDTGGLIWKKNFGGNGSDAVFSMVEDNSGNLIGAGYSNSFNFGSPLDLIVFKSDSSGNLLWKKTYGGTGVDIAYDVVASESGGYLVAGVNKDPALLAQYYVLHVDSTGGLLQDIFSPATEMGWNIFPIPAGEWIKINCEKCLEDCIISLSDLSGKIIFTKELPSDRKIFLGHISSGIYFVTLQSGESVSVKKIILTTD